jgi:hypothetical protein
MAISATKRAMCDSLVQRYPALVAPLNAKKALYKSYSNQVKQKLGALDPSSNEDVNNGIDDVNNQVGAHKPTSEDEVKDFLRNCPFFGDADKAVSALGRAKDKAFNTMSDFIDTLGLPEFDLGQYVDKINKLLDGAGFPFGDTLGDIFALADKLISCLSNSNLCGSEYTTEISQFTDELQQLYDEYDVEDDPLSQNYGKFKFDDILDQYNITGDSRTNINNSISSITDSQNELKSAYESLIDNI